MKSETKKITEGAMIVAIIGAMLVIDRQFANMISSQFSWLLSLPLIVYGAQSDRKYTYIVAFSSLFVGFFIGSIQTVFYLFCAMIIGIIFSEGVRQNWKYSKILIWTIVITFISYLCTMYIFAGFFGYDLIATRNEIISILENINFFGFKLVFLIDAKTLFNVIDISSFLMLVVLESLCILLLSHLIFMKLRIKKEKIVINLSSFTYPKSLSIGGIISLILVLALNFIEISDLFEYIIAFFYLTLFMINFVYGMIVLGYVAQLSRRIKLLMLILPIFWPFIMMLGIYDGLLDGKIRTKGSYGKTGKL